MSSEQAEVVSEQNAAPMAENIGAEKDPQVDNNNEDETDTADETPMEVSSPNVENAAKTDDGVPADGDGANDTEKEESAPEKSDEVEGKPAEGEADPPQDKEEAENSDKPEGATADGTDSVLAGIDDVEMEKLDEPALGLGRGSSPGTPGRQRAKRGKGKRFSLSPKAKKQRGRGRGRTITQSDFVFPDGEESGPAIKKPGINVVDKPDLMKPFDAGWLREHVLRGSADDHETGTGKKVSDVYYFAPPPHRKKIRSMVEISDYLIAHNMTDNLNSECFTFARCTIYKPPFDICRYSFMGKRLESPKTAKSISPKTAKPKPKADGDGSPLIVKLPVPKKAAEEEPDRGFKVVEIPGPGDTVKTLKIMRPPGASKAVAKKRTGGGKLKRTSDVAPAAPSAKKPSLMSGFSPRLCGMECPDKQGQPPELHCKKCMCLFHAECVGYSGTESDFICPECTRMNGVSSGQEQPNGAGLPPLHLGAIMRNPNAVVPRRPPPVLMRISPVPEPVPQVKVVGSFNVAPPPAITAVSSHVITLPPSVVGKIKLDAPLTLKTDGKDVVIPPSCMKATPEGMKVFLPPGVLSSAGVEPGLARAINIMPNPSNPQTMSVCSGNPTVPASKPINIPEVKVLDRTKVKVMKRDYPGINPAACFIQKAQGGLICCRRIFQFLTVQDRLRAAQVCKTWQDILSHPVFWNKVRLRDSTVMDWDKAASFLRNNNTKILDMRGLQHPNNDKNRTWHQFTGVLDKMVQLQEIHFDQCPVQILHSVAEKLTSLRMLSAQFVMDAVLQESQMWSTNAKIDFEKFKKMTDLEDLTIRGACGLVLVNGLNGLSSLTKLKSLSLATLKNIKDEDFKFLEPLKSMEELEFGDCDGIGEQGYKQIEKLTNLKKLRLEGKAEAGSSITMLGDSLKQLKSLKALELIKFPLNEEILPHLKELKLEQLTLWPETGTRTAEINSAVFKMVFDMKSLTSFEWAIMGDQIGEDSDNSTNCHQNESILMLKEEGEGKRVVNIREISEKLFIALPNARIRVFRINVPTQD